MLTRREFVVRGVTMTAGIHVLTNAASFAHALAAPGDERVLVVLQLSGGNDGLNMVPPRGQDAYFRLRPTLGISPKQAHPLDTHVGLHPAMSALARVHADGKLAIVQRVGYPSPNRSHFRSMEIWHTAEPGKPAGDLGWLGRMADRLAERSPVAMPLIHVGGDSLPLSAWAHRSIAPSIQDEEGFRLRDVHPRFAAGRARLLEGADAGELGFLRSAASSTYAAARRMSELAERDSGAEYPKYGLAERLHLVSRLVTGGFGTRIFALSLEGFDTHARQARSHEFLLRELSESLAAFERDLAAHGWSERVTTLVFSEFGRRAEENASQGTDHGAASPVLLVGGAVKAGTHGDPPDLEHLIEGDVPFSTDFRGLYSALESRWMGLEASSSLGPIDVLRT